MDLALSEEQEQLVSSFASLLAKASSPERVRAAEATGFDPDLWQQAIGTGAVVMGVPEGSGGWGASVLDLALVAELLGRSCASVPLIEAQVAGRLLAGVGCDVALGALDGLIGGTRIVTLAPRPARHGVAALVPGGAVCDAAVVLDGDRLLLLEPAATARRSVANLASAALADIDLEGATALVSAPDAVAAFERALDEWLVLTAAAVVGLGTAAHLVGCEYARERHAFGSPIGAFQGIAHPLADDATNLDGARLLVHKAAWALDLGHDRGRELAAMAFAFASTASEAATYNALHTHGGYGFMLEYDVQLHYRRARGWPRVWGDAEAAYRRAGAARYGMEGG